MGTGGPITGRQPVRPAALPPVAQLAPPRTRHMAVRDWRYKVVGKRTRFELCSLLVVRVVSKFQTRPCWFFN
eukprot:125534-Pyramimonas_sp.AAC.1